MTLVEPPVPCTVTVLPLTALIEPTAKPKLPKPVKCAGGAPPLLVPVGRPSPRPGPPWPKKPFEHVPLTGAEIVTLCASTAPLLALAPLAMTQTPSLSAERVAETCSMIVLEPLSEMVESETAPKESLTTKLPPLTETT